MTAPPIFLGGLPRSGSTLISAILTQNPLIDVTPTGFLLALLQGMQNQWTSSPARMAWLDTDDTERRLHRAIRGACEGYLGAGMTSIEKSRGALGFADLLERAFAEPPRIILPVRDLRGCIASMEKLWRNHPEHFGFGAGQHISQRVDRWLAPDDAPLGAPLAQLADAHHRGLIERCLIVRFEDLTANPASEIARIYRYIGDEYPADLHQFEAIEHEPREHDAVHGPFGDHRIERGPVRPAPQNTAAVLGEPICRTIVQRHEWYYRAFYPQVLEAEAQQ